MEKVRYQLRLCGLTTADGTVTARVLAGVLQNLTQFAERELRLTIEGQSVKRGHIPSWISKSTELVVTGLETGSTVLDIEAPTLGDTIGDQIKQQDFWIEPPKPSDTALTLVVRTVKDTTAEDLESEYYDGGVLESLLTLKSYLDSEKRTLDLHAIDRPEESFCLGMPELEKAERLQVRTPEPQAFIVSGHLDEITHSRQGFHLALPDGQIISGRVNEDFMIAEDMRPLWGKKVSVKGTVYFKPSGRVRMLDAHVLKPMAEGDTVFERMPQVQTEAAFVREATIAESRKDWLGEVWGRWPGDESIEELLADLNGDRG